MTIPTMTGQKYWVYPLAEREALQLPQPDDKDDHVADGTVNQCYCMHGNRRTNTR